MIYTDLRLFHPRLFRHWTVVIVASGPSLTEAQCELVRRARAEDRCRVIVVNDNYQRVPGADWLVAYDLMWWRVHADRVAKLCPSIMRWSIDARGREFGCNLFYGTSGLGMAEPDEPHIKRGSSSGFGATGLAIRHGARHVVLVGMDCKRAADGKRHWFGDHPPRLPAGQPFEIWAAEFDSLAEPAAKRGIRIINCTIDSAIQRLPRGDLAAELFGENHGQTGVAGGEGATALPG